MKYTCPQCKKKDQSIIQPSEDSYYREVYCLYCGHRQLLKYLNKKAKK